MSTKTTSVILIVGARNKASGALNAVGKSVDKLEDGVGKFADVAESANVSVADLIDKLGFGDLAGYGQQIADVRSEMVKFNAENVKGAKGLTAMKAGIVVAVAAISFELGKAIGDVIFQTAHWNRELEESIRLGRDLDFKILTKFLDRFKGGALSNVFANSGEKIAAAKQELSAIDAELENLQQSIDRQSKSFKEVAASETAWSRVTGDTKFRLEEINRTTQGLIDKSQGLIAKRKELLEGSKALANGSQSVLASLGAELNLLKATEEERLEIQLRQQGVFGAAIPVAIDLRKQIDAIKSAEQERAKVARELEAEKREAESARRKAAAEELSEQNRIASVYKTNINSLKEQLIGITKSKEAATAFRLEIQGVKSKDAKFLGGLKGQIEKLKKLKNQSSVETGNNTATNDRLGTGTVAAKFEKTAAVIEAERQTGIQRRLEILLEKLVKFGEDNKPLAVEVIG